MNKKILSFIFAWLIILCTGSYAFAVPNINAPDIKEINQARTILGITNILYPVESIDTNIIIMAQDIVDSSAIGVTVTLDTSNNSQINQTGIIIYGDQEIIGNVVFKLTKNKSVDTQSINVEVPIQYIDGLEVDNAKIALTGLILYPVEGSNINIFPLIQNIINLNSNEVTGNIISTNNDSQINTSGNIIYGITDTIVDVLIGLTKNDAYDVQVIRVMIPAKYIAPVNTAPKVTINTPTNDDNYINGSLITFSGIAIDMEDGNLSNKIEWISSWEGSLGRGDTLPISKLRIGTHIITARVQDNEGLYGITNITIKVTEPIGTNVIAYGANGNDNIDDTVAIQKAIDYVASIGGGMVYIPDGIYMIKTTTGIKLKDNIELFLTDKAILKAIPTSSGAYQIVWLNNIKNASIHGGAIIGERYEHIGTTGETGYGIRISSCSYINISNISISDCWGDGIILGGSIVDHTWCDNIIIDNIICNNNRRQGISVISVKGLKITNSMLFNTNGTPPQAGIDFEPDNNTQYIQDVLMQNVKITNNTGWGIDWWFKNLIGGKGEKVTIKIDNCIVTSNKLGQIRYRSGFTSGNSYYDYLDITINGMQIGKR